jgi:hypothetical protein
MKLELTIWLEQPQSDQSVKLFVRFEAEGFSGQGDAWVALSQVREFANAISAFPLDSEIPQKLVGGYLDPSGKSFAEEHVGIFVTPVGRTGEINILVRVAVPQDIDLLKEPKFSAAVSFRTDYEQLKALSARLRSLEPGIEERVSLTFRD